MWETGNDREKLLYNSWVFSLEEHLSSDQFDRSPSL